MGGRLTRAVVAGLLLAAPPAACSPDDEPAAPTATLGTAPPVTPTTDPYAVPAVIDAAYVNRVLEGLDAANGEILRIVMKAGTIPREVLDRLDSLYMGESIQTQRDLLAADLQSGFLNVRPDPANQRTRVAELVTAKSNCVFAQVEKDYSGVVVRTDPRLTRQWIILRPLDPARDPNNYNPTPWVYLYDGFQPDFTAPPNRCIDA